MNPLLVSLRSGWLIGLGSACAAGGMIVFALSRTSIGPPDRIVAAAPNPPPVVRFSPPQAQSEGKTWEVHSAMNDLAPLFLPSERNARLPALPLREPGDGTLDAQTASFRFREADDSFLANFPPTASLNGKSLSQASELDGLRADDTVSLAAGFGRQPLAISPTFSRGAVIEVFATRSGQIVDIKEISGESHPPWNQLWQPLEFLAAVDTGGLVSPLSLTVASRVDSVDAFFRDYLARTFRVGERLDPGFYRIVVSP